MNRVFPHYRAKGLDAFETPSVNLESALITTQDYISNLPAMKAQGMGLVYAGQNGVGKTHLACAVMSAAAAAGYKIECIDLFSYVKMHLDMFRLDARLRAGYDDQIDELDGIAQHLDYIMMRARFLLLDDLGREHESQSGWSNGQVFGLLRYRHTRNMPTIITTNLSFDELDERYTEGLSSYLLRATIMVEMKGDDWCVKGS